MGVHAKTFTNNNIWLFVVVVAGVLAYQYFFTDGEATGLFNTEKQSTEYVRGLLTDEELIYTKHADCRMECRTISKQEVESVLATGKVNWQKSNKDDKPCPSYALEGNTNDGQHVRIIFADCNNATKVVTTIDLENDYDCVCN